MCFMRESVLLPFLVLNVRGTDFKCTKKSTKERKKLEKILYNGSWTGNIY